MKVTSFYNCPVNYMGRGGREGGRKKRREGGGRKGQNLYFVRLNEINLKGISYIFPLNSLI